MDHPTQNWRPSERNRIDLRTTLPSTQLRSSVNLTRTPENSIGLSLNEDSAEGLRTGKTLGRLLVSGNVKMSYENEYGRVVNPWPTARKIGVDEAADNTQLVWSSRRVDLFVVTRRSGPCGRIRCETPYRHTQAATQEPTRSRYGTQTPQLSSETERQWRSAR